MLPLFGDVVYVTVRFDLKNSFTPTSDDDSGANADTVPNYEAERRAVAPVLSEADVSQSSTPCTCADSSLRPTFAWHGTEKVAADETVRHVVTDHAVALREGPV